MSLWNFSFSTVSSAGIDNRALLAPLLWSALAAALADFLNSTKV